MRSLLSYLSNPNSRRLSYELPVKIITDESDNEQLQDAHDSNLEVFDIEDVHSDQTLVFEIEDLEDQFEDDLLSIHSDCEPQNTDSKKERKDETVKSFFSYFTDSYSRIPTHEVPLGIISDDRSVDEFEGNNNDSISQAIKIEDGKVQLEVLEIEDVETQKEGKGDIVHSHYATPLNNVYHLPLESMENPAICKWSEYQDMCPISQKPLQISESIPAPLIKVREQKWKDIHANYYIHIDCNRDDFVFLSKKGQPNFERFLVPQERSVLELIKSRTRDRRKQQKYSNCATLILSIVILLFLSILSVKFGAIELGRPI
jgi:hypothetical protein